MRIDNLSFIFFFSFRLHQVTSERATPPDNDNVFRPVEEPSRHTSLSSLQVNRDDGTIERVELEVDIIIFNKVKVTVVTRHQN